MRVVDMDFQTWDVKLFNLVRLKLLGHLTHIFTVALLDIRDLYGIGIGIFRPLSAQDTMTVIVGTIVYDENCVAFNWTCIEEDLSVLFKFQLVDFFFFHAELIVLDQIGWLVVVVLGSEHLFGFVSLQVLEKKQFFGFLQVLLETLILLRLHPSWYQKLGFSLFFYHF